MAKTTLNTGDILTAAYYNEDVGTSDIDALACTQTATVACTTDIETTSTSYVTMGPLAATLTTTGGPCLMTLSIGQLECQTTMEGYVRLISVSSGATTEVASVWFNQGSGVGQGGNSCMGLVTPAAGSTAFRAEWKSTNGSYAIKSTNATKSVKTVLSVVEFKR